jgi:hypothetical protein
MSTDAATKKGHEALRRELRVDSGFDFGGETTAASSSTHAQSDPPSSAQATAAKLPAGHFDLSQRTSVAEPSEIDLQLTIEDPSSACGFGKHLTRLDDWQRADAQVPSPRPTHNRRLSAPESSRCGPTGRLRLSGTGPSRVSSACVTKANAA